MIRAIFVAAALGVGSASAATYQISYLTEDSGVFAVTLTGALQGDGDTIVVSAIQSAGLDGVAGPPLTFLDSFLDVANDNDFRDAVVTLSGAEMDLIACTEATCSDQGFLFTFAGLIGGGGAGLGSSPAFGNLNENFDPSRYSIATVAPEVIPLPSAALLLLTGVVALRLTGRRGR